MFFRKNRRSLDALRNANQARDEKRWTEASDFYRTYLEKTPSDAGVWVQLGHSYKESGNLDAAEVAYARALELSPNEPDTHLQLGHLLKLKKQWARAVSSFRLAYYLDPTLEDARGELAALGETIHLDDHVTEALTPAARIEKLLAEHAHFRRTVDSVSHSLEQFLKHAPTLNSVSFRLVACENHAAKIEAQFDPFRALPDRLRKLEIDLHSLTESDSQSRATAFIVAQLSRDLATLRNEYISSQTGLSAIQDSLQAVQKRSSEASAEAAEWRQAINSHINKLLTFASSAQSTSFMVGRLSHALSDITIPVKTLQNDFLAIGDALRSIEVALSTQSSLVSRNQEQSNARLEALATFVQDSLSALSTKSVETTRQIVEEQQGHLREEFNAGLQAVQSAQSSLASQFARISAGPAPIEVSTLIEALAKPATQQALNEQITLGFATNDRIDALESRVTAQLTRFGEVLTGLMRSPIYKPTDTAPVQVHETSETNARLSSVEELTSRLSAMQQYLVERMEFVRREMLFELRFGPDPRNRDKLEATTKIVSIDKFAAQREAPRLNLGCGHIPIEGYLNVDRRELPGVDIVAEVDKLPFESREVSEIFCAHLLEHFPQEQLKRQLLPYWLDLLRPGGRFTAIVPDMGEMVAATSRGDNSFGSFREVLFGAQDYAGDYHFNAFTAESLMDCLNEVGFSSVTIVARGRRNGSCLECEVSGSRPTEPDR